MLPRAANNVRFFADYAVERLAEPPRTLVQPRSATIRPAWWRCPHPRHVARRPRARGGQHAGAKPAGAGAADVAARRPRRRGGLPPGVLTFVHGTGAEAGAPRPGTAVDRALHRLAGDRPHRVPRRRGRSRRSPSNFGGKSPFLVFEDADLDAAVRTAAYQFDNSGQVCLADIRLLVQRSTTSSSSACSAAAGKISSATRGETRPATTRSRSSASPATSPGRASRARGSCSAASSSGGLFYAPTLFTDIPADAEILQREVFGPVLKLQAFDDEAEAIALADARSAWPRRSTAMPPAIRAAVPLRHGVGLNTCFYARDLETPFAARGIGRGHSFQIHGDVKTVCERTALCCWGRDAMYGWIHHVTLRVADVDEARERGSLLHQRRGQPAALRLRRASCPPARPPPGSRSTSRTSCRPASHWARRARGGGGWRHAARGRRAGVLLGPAPGGLRRQRCAPDRAPRARALRGPLAALLFARRTCSRTVRASSCSPDRRHAAHRRLVRSVLGFGITDDRTPSGCTSTATTTCSRSSTRLRAPAPRRVRASSTSAQCGSRWIAQHGRREHPGAPAWRRTSSPTCACPRSSCSSAPHSDMEQLQAHHTPRR